MLTGTLMLKLTLTLDLSLGLSGDFWILTSSLTSVICMFLFCAGLFLLAETELGLAWFWLNFCCDYGDSCRNGEVLVCEFEDWRSWQWFGLLLWVLLRTWFIRLLTLLCENLDSRLGLWALMPLLSNVDCLFRAVCGALEGLSFRLFLLLAEKFVRSVLGL